MFLRIGSQYLASVFIEDVNGLPVLTDTPTVTIKDSETNLYWNGLSWVNSEFGVVIPHISQGVYGYTFIPMDPKTYIITIKSLAYNITKIETIEVYTSESMRYSWTLNRPFMIKYRGSSENQRVIAQVTRNVDNRYFTGQEWTISPTTFDIPHIANNVYGIQFIPDMATTYFVTVRIDEEEVSYILDVALEDEGADIKLVSSETLRALDGSNSQVIDEKGNPVPASKVIAVDLQTKNTVAETLTNSAGEWNFMLKPGSYQFIFQKDGFMPVGFERTVV